LSFTPNGLGRSPSSLQFRRSHIPKQDDLKEGELEELKPIYDLYAAYAAQLHEINFGAEEMVVEFHPEWPGT
jgi:hypothetical protein